ncbi:hypothetical protein [Sulfobacillus sp. hq2]|nr:hypothetical protein [Sulfobacillus sp. hq2]MCY0909470.1 hypothetical protein [Sulfobacillus thermotolerans]
MMTPGAQSRIAIRLPHDLRARIQRLAQRWPGRPTESYMIRYLIERALPDAERERIEDGSP